MRDLVRSGFRLILEREPDIEVVGEAVTAPRHSGCVAPPSPTSYFMDIRMPVMDGIAVTQQTTAAGQTPRVLILTTFDLDELVYGARLAEASGFLLKDVKTGVLAPSLTRRLIGRFVATRPRNPGSSAALDELTAREREVLVAHRAGLSHAEIAESLVVSPAAVKTHVGRVFAKVGARDRAQAVVRAYEHGLVEAPLRQRCAVCPQHFPRPFAQWASSPAAHGRRAGVGVIIRH